MSTVILPGPLNRSVTESSGLRIHLSPAVPMTQDQYFDFCQQNPDLRFERTAEGELIVMAPSGGESGFQDAEVCIQLGVWAKSVGKGKVTGSSGGFTLPNGANRAPDAAWLSPEQLATITPEERKKFLPVCPFFLIEVRSPSDSLQKLLEKMAEYIANGCQFGWLIDPEKRQVHVFRPNQEMQRLDNPATVQGDPELPGFVLDLGPVWQP